MLGTRRNCKTQQDFLEESYSHRSRWSLSQTWWGSATKGTQQGGKRTKDTWSLSWGTKRAEEPKTGNHLCFTKFFFFICVASTPNNTFWASQINCWNWAFVDFFHSTSQATLPTLQPSGCESARQYARKRHNFGTMVSPNVDRWSKCRGWGLRYEGQVKKYKEIDAM